MHTSERPFMRCIVCKICFILKSNLNHHKEFTLLMCPTLAISLSNCFCNLSTVEQTIAKGSHTSVLSVSKNFPVELACTVAKGDALTRCKFEMHPLEEALQVWLATSSKQLSFEATWATLVLKSIWQPGSLNACWGLETKMVLYLNCIWFNVHPHKEAQKMPCREIKHERKVQFWLLP